MSTNVQRADKDKITVNLAASFDAVDFSEAVGVHGESDTETAIIDDITH